MSGSLFDSLELFTADDIFALDSIEDLLGDDVSMGIDTKPNIRSPDVSTPNYQQQQSMDNLKTIDPLLIFDSNILNEDSDDMRSSPSTLIEESPAPEEQIVLTEEACLEVHDYCLAPLSTNIKQEPQPLKSNLKGHQRNGSTGSTPEGSLDDGVGEEIDFDEYDEYSNNDIDLDEDLDDEDENESLSVNIRENRKTDKTSCKSSKSPTSSPQSGSRRRTHMERHLTDEERRLLSKEGYSNFPGAGVPLTKQEEKVLRKVRRKIRNKKSAQCSRQRKKEYVEELEKKYEKCTSENSSLKREIYKLKQENSSLLTKMKSMLGSVAIKSSTSSTTGVKAATITRSQSNNLLRPTKVFASSFLGCNSESNGSSENDSSDDGLSGQTSFKTSFFVLCLSFLLVIFPFLT
jgi:hypothetical protein